MTGKVVRLMGDRGFGFIQGEDGQDYFMHQSALTGGLCFQDLKAGQEVTFDVGQGPKGPRAENVRQAR